MPAYFRHYYFLESTWYVMFSPTKFESGINICHKTFHQCVRIKPHLSNLANVENSTSNFRQSVQICCGEKGREENNSNCKAFGVTRKRNKDKYIFEQMIVYQECQN